MSEWEQDTMVLVLAREQNNMEDSQQQQPHSDGADEVDSLAPSPCAAATASHRGRTECEGSQDPTPSTSMAEMPTLSGDTVPTIALKSKQKNAMSQKKQQET